MNSKLENQSFTPSHIWMVSSEVIRSGIGDIVLRSWADKGVFSVPLEKARQGVARRYPTSAVYEALLIRILSDHGLDLKRISFILKDVQEKLATSDRNLPEYIVLQGHPFPSHPHFFDNESLKLIFEDYREVRKVNYFDAEAGEVRERITSDFTPHSIRVIKFREMIEQIDNFLLQIIESDNR